MLKNNNKVLLHILLVPSYLILVGLAMFFLFIIPTPSLNEIIWKSVAVSLLLNIAGAWFLSLSRNLWANVAGVFCFIAFSYPLIFSYRSYPRSLFWQIEIKIGITITIISVLAFVYNLIKWRKSSKELNQ
ncbi:hypothetical protein [Alkaliphilus peptidifermentans]|nr:hypothetical protein [Alkaliphilus peptidifermentans]